MSNPTIKAEHLAEYQNLQDEVRALIALAADASGIQSLTNNVGYWNAAGVFTSILDPSIGATDPRMVASRDYAFFTDGVAADLKKWHIDHGLSKWGIDAPLNAISVAASSTTTQTWLANTIFSTFGLLTDQNNNIEQLVTTNANNTNPVITSANPGAAPNPTGLSGVGTPPWNNTTFGMTADSGITWQCRGPIALWTPNTFYNNVSSGLATPTAPAAIYDPITNSVYVVGNAALHTGTSGTTRPAFTGIIGKHVVDNGGDNGVGLDWFCVSPQPPSGWLPSHTFAANSYIVEPTLPSQAFNTNTQTLTAPIFIQFTASGGTTSASFATTTFSTTIGGLTNDNQLQWLNLGSKTWVANTAYTQWNGQGNVFSVIVDTNGNYQVAFVSGTSGGSQPAWKTGYGDQTPDGGTLIWVNVGQTLSWAASTSWFMGPNGWSVPTSKGSFTGSEIVDSNGDIETVIESGKSGGSAPSWNGPGQNTTDGGVTWFNLGVLPTGSGEINLVKGRNYFLVFANSVSGNFSNLSPVSVSTGAVTNGQIFLGSLAVSSDPQVDMKVILATADGGDQTTLYFVAELPNQTLTYVDVTPEPILLAANIFQETDSAGIDHGVADNTPPPNGSFLIKYRGRLYMLVGSFLFFSKALSDVTTSTGLIAGRYEEDWPADFQTDISEGAEVGKGLFTDGYVLYIGTQRHIRRITGDGPANFTSPEVIFNEVGINNQDVWQPIFLEGTPAGSMWLTPDFRVIRSDFNTYQNAGELIQKTLNTINPAASNNCWASYLGQNGYNFYVLAIPTGTNTEPDTLCVYNIQTGTWFIWTPADLLRCALYYLNLNGQPRFVVNSNDGSIYLFDPTVSMDRATGVDRVGITSTIRTVFSDMTDASTRKALNEIELDTTQTNMSLTVEGATSDQEFVNPNVVISNGKLIKNLFGEYKLYLAGLKSQDRFYRLTLSDTSNNTSTVDDEILSYYSFEAIPLHRN